MNTPIPQGTYIPVTRAGNLAFTAGMTPREAGELVTTGTVPADADPARYRDTIRLACANALTALHGACDAGEKISRILRMTVYVAAEPGFTLHSRFADIASEFVIERLGKEATGARTAVGVASLPGDAPLEIDLIGVIAEDAA